MAKKDRRWLVAGVGCGIVLALGAGFAFGSADTLSSVCSMLGCVSKGELLSGSSMFVLRAFGFSSMIFGAFGLLVVNSSSVLYTTSLAWTLYKYKLQGNNHFDEVLKNKIVLGAIPLKGSRNHLERLPASSDKGGMGITGVVCLLEQHEVKGDYFFQPVQPEEWKSKNVKFLWIKTQDYEPVDPKALIEGADFIHQVVDVDGGKVYVHCKAGRGRSSACVVTYLVKYHSMSVDEAFAELKKYRKQVHLNSRQLKAVRDAASIIAKKD